MDWFDRTHGRFLNHISDDFPEAILAMYEAKLIAIGTYRKSLADRYLMTAPGSVLASSRWRPGPLPLLLQQLPDISSADLRQMLDAVDANPASLRGLPNQAGDAFVVPYLKLLEISHKKNFLNGYEKQAAGVAVGLICLSHDLALGWQRLAVEAARLRATNTGKMPAADCSRGELGNYLLYLVERLSVGSQWRDAVNRWRASRLRFGV